jgi:hypothetical protein
MHVFGENSTTHNVSVPLTDNAGKMPDLRANNIEWIVNNGSVPLIDNASQRSDRRENSK